MAVSLTPIAIDLERTSRLSIRWSDGSETVISLVSLRRACPCATCRAGREERAQNPLAVIAPPADVASQVTASSAELVGAYALRVRWADGHDTGIYDFGLLRRLGQP